MRFKAKLASDQVSLLYNTIAPLAKLQDPHKGAVVYLDPEYLRISVQNKVTCFCELSKSQLCLEHQVESQADNVIVFQLDLVSFKLALQSVLTSQKSGNAPSPILLKLAKRQGLPCLCVDGTQAVDIHQAIPVRLLRATDMAAHLPPAVATPQVQLEWPLARSLRGLMDKLKGMADYGESLSSILRPKLSFSHTIHQSTWKPPTRET